jgi:hypothetical protein
VAKKAGGGAGPGLLAKAPLLPLAPPPAAGSKAGGGMLTPPPAAAAAAPAATTGGGTGSSSSSMLRVSNPGLNSMAPPAGADLLLAFDDLLSESTGGMQRTSLGGAAAGAAVGVGAAGAGAAAAAAGQQVVATSQDSWAAFD